MRSSLDGPTSTLYTGGVYDTHIRLKVENGSGTFISLEGRYTRISLRQPDPKEPIGSMAIEVVRDITSEGVVASLSPLVEASDFNEDDGGAYSPLLQIGRQVTLDANLTAVGGARPADADSTWYEIFRGVIGKVDWPKHYKHLLSVDVDGLAAVLQHAKSEAEYTYTAGTSLETVVSEILSNNGHGSVPTFFPAATGKVLPNDWEPGLQKTVWGQIVSVAQSMGWVVYYRYRGQNPADVTVFEPARSKTVADHSVVTDDFHAISVDDAEVRNVGFLAYVDANGIEQTLGPDTDAASLTKYGGTLGIRRPFFIRLDGDSPVRAETEAQEMLTAALSDVADPDVVATANTMPLIFAESGVDLYDIAARDRFFDTAQKWALFGNEIAFVVDKEPRSSLGLRGVPTAGVKSWRDMTAIPPQRRPLEPVYPQFDSLVGYWPADNFAGTKLYDVSGNDADADVGTAATTRVQGVSGMAIDFPGSGSGYTLLADAAAGAIEDLFYVSCWINVDDVAGDAAARLFSRDVSDYWAIQLQQNEAFPQDLVIQKTPTSSVTLDDFIKTASTWYFILCQWDHTNNIFECWVGERDGDLALIHRDEALAAKGTTTRPIVFGSNTEATIGTLGPFDGSADDLRIGSGNLHKNEIEALFKFPGAPGPRKITGSEVGDGELRLGVTDAFVTLSRGGVDFFNYVADAGDGLVFMAGSSNFIDLGVDGTAHLRIQAGTGLATFTGANLALQQVALEDGSTVAGHYRSDGFFTGMYLSNNLSYDGSGDPRLAVNNRYINAAGGGNAAGVLVYIRGNNNESGTSLDVFTAPTSTGAGATPASMTLRFRVQGDGITFVGDLLTVDSVAGSSDIGTAAVPFGQTYIGNAAFTGSDAFLNVIRTDGSGSSNTLLAGYSYLDVTAAATGAHIGFEGRIAISATTGTVTNAWAQELFQVVTGAAAITNLRGLLIQSHLQTGSGVTTEYTGIKIEDPIVTAGSITTAYGIKLAGITTGDTNFAIYTEAGSIRFGDDVSIGQGALSAVPLTIRRDTTSTAVLDNMIVLQARTSGTAAAGFGGKVVYEGEDDGGTVREMGFIGFTWFDLAGANLATEIVVVVKKDDATNLNIMQGNEDSMDFRSALNRFSGTGEHVFSGGVLIDVPGTPALDFNTSTATAQRWNMGVNDPGKYFFISDITFSQGRFQIEENGGPFKFIDGDVGIDNTAPDTTDGLHIGPALTSSFGRRLRIRETTTSASGTVQAARFEIQSLTATTGSLYPLECHGRAANASGTIANIHGIKGLADMAGAGTATSVIGVQGQALQSAGTITNLVAINAVVSQGGTTTNAIGLDVSNVSGASNNFAIRTGTGLCSFGDNISVAGTLAVTGEVTLGSAAVSNAILNTADSMFFNIDSNNDETDKKFVWAKNATGTGGTELMKLEEGGLLTIPGTLAVTGNMKGSAASATVAGLTIKATDNLAAQRILDINNDADVFRMGLEYNNPGPALDIVDRNRVSLFTLVEATGAVTLAGTLAVTGVAKFADGLASAPSITFTADTDTGLFRTGVNGMQLVTGGVDRISMNSSGFVGINATSNANMTIGLTINQGANDNEILALRSSDVGHGMTELAETDIFGTFDKPQSLAGGLRITGYSDADENPGHALQFSGVLGEAADTTKTTAGRGVVVVDGKVKSGTGTTAIGADGNVFTIVNSGTTRFIFDADGDSHQDVGTAWTNFDDRDDALMTRSLAIVMDRASIIESGWDDFGRDHLGDMISCGLIPRLTAAQIANGERALVNTTQVMRLHNGAIWQNAIGIKDAHSRQDSMEDCLRFLVEHNPSFTGREEALALLEIN